MTSWRASCPAPVESPGGTSASGIGSGDKAAGFCPESPGEQGRGSEGGADGAIHQGLTQQKTERWERPLGCKGPANSNDIFGRLSGCPIREADI